MLSQSDSRAGELSHSGKPLGGVPSPGSDRGWDQGTGEGFVVSLLRNISSIETGV